jgi:hypothetical protein
LEKRAKLAFTEGKKQFVCCGGVSKDDLKLKKKIVFIIILDS